MKLLYVYIQSFGKLLEEVGFEFSNEHIAVYSEEDRTISISKNDNYLDGFYGQVISDIKAIVGKNGVGKTTLLNLIGRTLKDRVELTNIDKDRDREILDKYFLIYHVKDNIFYFEGVGNIEIKNIEGYEKLTNKKNTVFHSFFFENDNSNLRIMEYDNFINDKIVYINNNYMRSTSDLFDLYNPKGRIETKELFLPRVLGDNLSLVEWYSVYVDLCNENMVNSKNITILFSKDINVKKEDFFVIEPIKKECRYELDYRLFYVDENIEDFFSHFMSCIVHYYKELSLKVCEEYCNVEWNDLKNKYYKKSTFSVSDYRKIFNRCKEIITKYEESLRRDETSVIIEYIEYVSALFFALYDIKDYVIPGISEFQLKLSGEQKNDKIEYFFKCFMELKDFIDYNFGNDEAREDWEYHKEKLLFKYDGRNINIKFPIYLNRINISTGENNLIELLSKIAYEVKRYCEIQPFATTGEDKTYIILVDEIESTMHLEWSRNLMNFIIKYIEKQGVKMFEKPYSYADLGVKVQLIFTTHSPFLLSDLNRDSIIALEIKDGITKKKKDICAFAQNIQRVMNNEFFIRDCYGSFAQNKIQEVIKRLDKKNKKPLNDEEKKNLKLTIDEIGEPLLRDKLNEMYIVKLNKHNDTSYEELKVISKLKDVYGDLSNEDIIEKLKMLLKDEV